MLDSGRLVELGSSSVVTDAYLRKSFSSSAHSLVTANVERQSDIESGLKILSFSINDGKSLLHGETATLPFRSSQHTSIQMSRLR